MKCPICPGDTIVVKTLGVERRRKCTVCEHRFTTIEKLKEDEQRQAAAIEIVLQAAEKLAA